MKDPVAPAGRLSRVLLSRFCCRSCIPDDTAKCCLVVGMSCEGTPAGNLHFEVMPSSRGSTILLCYVGTHVPWLSVLYLPGVRDRVSTSITKRVTISLGLPNYKLITRLLCCFFFFFFFFFFAQECTVMSNGSSHTRGVWIRELIVPGNKRETMSTLWCIVCVYYYYNAWEED